MAVGNLAAIIADHDHRRIALIDGDAELTYGELRHRVDRLRGQLSAAGHGVGARLGILAGNETDFAIATLAVLGLGGVVVPIRPTSPIPELRRKLDVVAPAAVLVGDAGRWVLDGGDAELSVPLVDLADLARTAETGGATDGAGEPPPIVERSDDDLAFLMLTSGVSSEAKVAMLSHGNLAWVQRAITADPDDGLGPDDTALGVLPFSHIFGLNVVLLATLRVGGAIVLQRRFDTDLSLELIRRHGITTLSGAPPMWQRWAVADAPDDSLATIRNAASGAASLPAEVFEAIRARYGVEIGEGYGLTETSPVVTWSRGMPIKATSVGKPLDGVDVVLVEPDGTPVEAGDTGEIVVRSPGVFQGYLDAPELTEAVLTDDGWFWTGDIGVLDDDGYLYLVDRLKDIIIVSGFNVYPSEVESVLMEHPEVDGAVVVGSPHGDTGEMVVAYVSGRVETAELHAFARERLSTYKCPTEYHLVDDLPMAPTGKLIRRELRS